MLQLLAHLMGFKGIFIFAGICVTFMCYAVFSEIKK